MYSDEEDFGNACCVSSDTGAESEAVDADQPPCGVDTGDIDDALMGDDYGAYTDSDCDGDGVALIGECMPVAAVQGQSVPAPAHGGASSSRAALAQTPADAAVFECLTAPPPGRARCRNAPACKKTPPPDRLVDGLCITCLSSSKDSGTALDAIVLVTVPGTLHRSAGAILSTCTELLI